MILAQIPLDSKIVSLQSPSPDQSTMENVFEVFPATIETRNTFNPKDDASEMIDVPAAILPINSPIKPENIEEKEEVHILICASNQEAADRLTQSYPNPIYVKNANSYIRNINIFYKVSWFSRNFLVFRSFPG